MAKISRKKVTENLIKYLQDGNSKAFAFVTLDKDDTVKVSHTPGNKDELLELIDTLKDNVINL